ncbi:MAG: metalloregulator ArsR/SmtB family transcription factor [Rhizobiales bacterium]|nr:metalloregulator ArsR/SmtB family transcription factor [Hyphomicrobiales bacterium]
MEKPALIAMFGALAQETRVDIMRYLVECGTGGVPAGAIGEHLGVASQTLAFHLNCLANAGLVSRHRKGRNVIYTADIGRLNDIVCYMLENCCSRQGVDCVPAASNAALRRKISKRAGGCS